MKNIILLIIIFSSISSCRDRDQNPNVLPEATQSGKNTGGALVDGKIWVAKDEYPTLNGGGVNATIYEHANDEYKLKIVFRQVDNLDNRIVIYLADSYEITNKTYVLDENNVAGYEKGLENNYITNVDNTGFITITKFDKTNKIVSGTFSFKAKNGDGKTVTITDGRFDKRFL